MRDNALSWWDVVDANTRELHDLAIRWGGDLATPQILTWCISERDASTLYHLLHLIWHQAPDEPETQQMQGWQLLCDLLDGTIQTPPEVDQV